MCRYAILNLKTIPEHKYHDSPLEFVALLPYNRIASVVECETCDIPSVETILRIHPGSCCDTQPCKYYVQESVEEVAAQLDSQEDEYIIVDNIVGVNGSTPPQDCQALIPMQNVAWISNHMIWGLECLVITEEDQEEIWEQCGSDYVFIAVDNGCCDYTYYAVAGTLNDVLVEDPDPRVLNICEDCPDGASSRGPGLIGKFGPINEADADFRLDANLVYTGNDAMTGQDIVFDFGGANGSQTYNPFGDGQPVLILPAPPEPIIETYPGNGQYVGNIQIGPAILMELAINAQGQGLSSFATMMSNAPVVIGDCPDQQLEMSVFPSVTVGSLAADPVITVRSISVNGEVVVTDPPVANQTFAIDGGAGDYQVEVVFDVDFGADGSLTGLSSVFVHNVNCL